MRRFLNLSAFLRHLFMILVYLEIHTPSSALEITGELNESKLLPELWTRILSQIDPKTFRALPLVSTTVHAHFLDHKQILFTSGKKIGDFINNAAIAPHYSSYSTIRMNPYWTSEWQFLSIKYSLFVNAADINSFFAVHPTIKILSMEHINFSNQNKDKKTRAFAEALRTNTSLEILHLTDNSLSDKELSQILNALSAHKNLRDLCISKNQMSNCSLKAMTHLVQNNISLVALYLINTHINNKGANIIAEALIKNTTLKSLYLSNNKITIKGANLIIKKSRNLKKLDLQDNKLSHCELKLIHSIMTFKN